MSLYLKIYLKIFVGVTYKKKNVINPKSKYMEFAMVIQTLLMYWQ